jgi:membrane glycosyltransferase
MRPAIPPSSTTPLDLYRPPHGASHLDSPRAAADPGGRPPAECGSQPPRVLARRRAVMAALVAATLAALTAAIVPILAHGGWTILDGVVLSAFVVSAPWTIIGFWNAVIGFAVLHLARDTDALIAPFASRARRDTPIASRVALLMTIRNEAPGPAFARLAVMREALDATPWGAAFDVFVLSDSSRSEIAAAEEAAFAALRSGVADPTGLVYRRRPANAGFKAGNIRDFLEHWGDDCDLMVPLDADSLMSAETILRLVRIVEASPEIGILQSLVVGMPAPTLFGRLFQFGMRHGMRSYTAGSAWWHGDCGPFWGHNAVIRVAPFRRHCGLRDLPGRPPLGGPLLSHDQVEAALMRRAGYEVRVIAHECGSFEENPPALPDFLKRDLRWCQGNMQYFRLLALPGLKPTSRVQLALAIQMYLGAAGWMVFVAASTLKVLEPPATAEPFPAGLGLALFLVVLTMSLTPKAMGVADVLVRPAERARYGGGPRLVLGALAEFAASTILAPTVALADTIFMAGLLFGRRVGWDGQKRTGYRLAWRQALAGLWPQVAAGLAIAALIGWNAPSTLPWAAPILAGLLLAPAVAVVTALPALGRWAAARRICAVPEEFVVDPTLAALASRLAEQGGKTSHARPAAEHEPA